MDSELPVTEAQDDDPTVTQDMPAHVLEALLADMQETEVDD